MSEADHGWSEEAIKAFSDRAIAVHELQKAEKALAVARATLRQAQRAYERTVDAMIAGRRALAEAGKEAGRG